MSVKHSKKSVEQWSDRKLPDIEQLVKDYPELTREFLEDIIDAERSIAEGDLTPYKFG